MVTTVFVDQLKSSVVCTLEISDTCTQIIVHQSACVIASQLQTQGHPRVHTCVRMASVLFDTTWLCGNVVLNVATQIYQHLLALVEDHKRMSISEHIM